ncbi:MAG: hypothetical protein QM734_08765 [Cyclobacteriaceae bacterium]
MNQFEKENFIHAKEIIVGKNCSIFGLGKNGVNVIPGDQGTRQMAPCTAGAKGKDALPEVLAVMALAFSLLQ